MDRSQRTQEIIEQLTRYGGTIASDDLCVVLDKVTDLNDDIANMRSVDCVNERVEEIVKALEHLAWRYEP